MSYSSPADGFHREPFIKSRCIVGGALAGDISGACPLHAVMTIGEDNG